MNDVIISTSVVYLILWCNIIVFGCPDNCDCSQTGHSGRILVNCTDKKLTTFPTSLPNDTEQIVFVNNPDLAWPSRVINDSSWSIVTSMVFENNRPLRNLTIENISWLTRLKSLTIRRSQLVWIEDSLFGSLPNLEHIDLSINPGLEYDVIFGAFNSSNMYLENLNISMCNNLPKQTILQQKHLQKLSRTPIKVLDMTATNLFDITKPGLSYFLPEIEVLNISHNHLKIEYRILCDIANLKKLEIFDISFWNTPDLFYRVERSAEVTSSNVSGVDLKNKRCGLKCFPLAESLRLFYFHHIRWSSADSPSISKCISKNSMTKVWLNNNNYRIFNGSIRGGDQLLLMDMSQNNIEYYSPEMSFYEPLLQVLDLSDNQLHKTEDDPTFTDLVHTNKYMQYVDLSNNSLSTLPYNIFSHSQQFVFVNLSQNLLCSKLNLNITSPWLRLVDLSHNKISYLNEELRTTFDKVASSASSARPPRRFNVSDEIPPVDWSTLTLDLSDNPFQCACAFVDFLLWMKNTQVTLHNVENYECEFKGKMTRISELSVSDIRRLCDMELNNVLFAVLVVPFVIIILAVSYFIVRKFRRSKVSQIVCQYKSSEQPKYVAFVCYSHHDSEFVLSDLRPELEGRLAKDLSRSDGLLCINDRDFCIGEPIEDAIVRSVLASSMVILIVSEKFLDSQWCKFETNVAWTEKKPILMIFRQKIETDRLPHLLKNIYNKHVRLLWLGERSNLIDTLYKSMINQL
ncbi:toll-like receptor 4 [Patella vulgata]|uniref:toll-like receptor 4 n=1 Tax=Patella vulgata TaxID=6465 RepID=UPI00217FE518|nr:toll-like receptor 4 [Patella vulgata]